MNTINETKETNMNEKQVIIDLVNKIKYEVTEEQLAELAGCATPLAEAEFVDWHARIDDLNLIGGTECPWFKGEMATQLRDILHRIVGVSRRVGGRAVQIGKRIVKWIFSVLSRYPSTLAAAVVMAALAFLAASVPLIGQLLLPIVQVAAIGIVGLVFFNESILNHRIAVLVAR